VKSHFAVLVSTKHSALLHFSSTFAMTTPTTFTLDFDAKQRIQSIFSATADGKVVVASNFAAKEGKITDAEIEDAYNRYLKDDFPLPPITEEIAKAIRAARKVAEQQPTIYVFCFCQLLNDLFFPRL
jgi:hypothetical protein